MTAKRFLPILKVKQCKGGVAYEPTVYRRHGSGLHSRPVAAGAAVCAALGSRPEAFWRLLPALLGKGLQLAFGIAQPWCFLVLVGAVLFWISHLLRLFLYFYPPKRLAVHSANLLTYYYAMLLTAVSLAV